MNISLIYSYKICQKVLWSGAPYTCTPGVKTTLRKRGGVHRGILCSAKDFISLVKSVGVIHNPYKHEMGLTRHCLSYLNEVFAGLNQLLTCILIE